MSLSGNEVLAIDAGTQGINAILYCPEKREILGTGDSEYAYDYIPDLPEGRLEQFAHYWTDALSLSMNLLRKDVRDRLGSEITNVSGIGVTGHMHCMVRKIKDGSKPYGCDMWNDPRGVPESSELHQLFNEHMPSRWTVCHILSGMRNNPSEWSDVTGVNVSSGSIVHDLCGEWVIGPGDASGMMGNLGADGQFDKEKSAKVDAATNNQFTPLAEMLPRIIPAGEIAGTLNEQGSKILGGLPLGTPIAAPEGDQQSVLIGAAADELELALSAGTSFAGNLPCRTELTAESETINVLKTPDMLTMLMVCVRNGTIGFAQYVSGLAKLSGKSFEQIADDLTDDAMSISADANGIDLLGFWQGENVVKLPHAKGSIKNAGIELLAQPGLMARLLLEAPCMSMKYGLEQLRPQIGEVKRVLLSGGALKSKDGFAPQMYADILGVPVVARLGDEEGSAKGAAILAAFMVGKENGSVQSSLADFAKEQAVGDEKVWKPNAENSAVYQERYLRFETAVKNQQQSE